MRKLLKEAVGIVAVTAILVPVLLAAGVCYVAARIDDYLVRAPWVDRLLNLSEDIQDWSKR